MLLQAGAKSLSAGTLMVCVRGGMNLLAVGLAVGMVYPVPG